MEATAQGQTEQTDELNMRDRAVIAADVEAVMPLVCNAFRNIWSC